MEGGNIIINEIHFGDKIGGDKVGRDKILNVSNGNNKSKNIIALGLMIVLISAAIIGVIMAVALILGLVDENIALQIILGCVGLGGVSGIIRMLYRKDK